MKNLRAITRNSSLAIAQTLEVVHFLKKKIFLHTLMPLPLREIKI